MNRIGLTIFIYCLFCIFDTSSILFGQSYFHKIQHYTLEDGLNSLRVTSVIKDRDGRIWVGTESGIQIFDGKRFIALDETFGKEIISYGVHSLFKDSKDNIYYTSNRYVIKIPYPYRDYEKIKLPEKKGYTDFRSKYFEDDKGQIYVYNHHDIIKVNDDKCDLLFDINTYRRKKKHGEVRAVKNLSNGNVVMITDFGIIIFDQNDEFVHFHDLRIGKGKYPNSIYLTSDVGEAITLADEECRHYRLSEDGLKLLNNEKLSGIDFPIIPYKNGYISCYDQTVSYLVSNKVQYSFTLPFYVNIENVYTDNEDVVWIATNFGLTVFKIYRERFDHINPNNNLSARQVKQLENGDYLLIQGKSAYTTNDFTDYKYVDKFIFDPFATVQCDDEITAISYYTNYSLPISSRLLHERPTYGFAIQINDSLVVNGKKHILNTFNLDSKKEDRITSHKLNANSFSKKDSNSFFVGYKNGLRLYSLEGEVLNEWNVSTNPKLSYPEINCIYPLGDSILCLGTNGRGIDFLNINQNTIHNAGVDQGLSNGTVYSIVFDGFDFWVGTQRGLTKYDRNNNRFYNYYKSDGLPDDEFNRYSSLIESDGHIIMGTMKGWVRFHPDDFKQNKTNSQIYFSKVEKYSLSERDYEDIHPNTLLEKGIVFDPSVSHYNLNFGVSNSMNQSIIYSYKIDNKDEIWIPIGSNSSLQINNLVKGDHTLHLKANLSDGGEAFLSHPISIQSTPPFTQSYYFPLLMSLLLAGLGYGIYRWRLTIKEAESQKEMDAFKSKYYTNITHEFRTPLTVIKGLISRLPKGDDRDAIARNSDRLLSLVNQLLDIRKLEKGQLKVNADSVEVISYLNYLVENFRIYVQEKDIDLRFVSEIVSLNMDVDKELLHTIVNNLISNAIKYTPTYGRIAVQVSQKNTMLNIVVEDSGKGISSGNLSRIFDRFYNDDNGASHYSSGTGIGLALSKELVQLLGGNISVKSVLGQGSTFSILLPIVNGDNSLESEKFKDSTPSNLLNNNIKTIYRKEAPIVLIVEDNLDIRSYIYSTLAQEYNIIEARNGQEGVELAIEQIPDLILTDVMMPFKDGLELTEELKSDERTSHIPIVMLTALADVEERIKGLEYGADDYIAKPFNELELKLRIHNILESRRKLRDKYTNTTLLNPQLDNPIDNSFYIKIKTLIDDNYSHDQFGVDMLADLATMSSRQLLRKLKAIIDKTPKELITEARMQAAARYLKSSDKSIKEICYEVGYNNSANFSTAFKKWSGLSPSDYRN